MFKVVFRVRDVKTGNIRTSISQGYVDRRIDALAYANSVKQEYAKSDNSKVVDFHVIGIGGIRK